MDKYELSSSGVEALNKMLFQMDDDELYQKASRLAADPVEFIAAYFELQVYQLEFLRGLSKDFIKFLGYNTAAMLMVRRPINFIKMTSNYSCRSNFMLISISLSVHLAENTVTSSGQLEIRL